MGITRYIGHITGVALLIAASPSPATGQASILLAGTWAMDVNADPFDPFTKRYPVISYLPAGTILFETESAPLGRNYISVLTQNGFWVQIAKPAAGRA